MPLETATYIPQLVASNPANSDGLNSADDHMRLIKGALLATFPNFTATALTSTQAQLDGAALKVNTNGVAILADAGAFFKTNTTDGFTNPSSGTLGLSLNGNIAATFARSAGVNLFTWNGNQSVTGTLSVTGAISGPGTIPIGGMIMWTTDTLPTGNGVWCWANGGTLNRTTAGAGKELYDLYTAQLGSGTFYGAGNGTTTFNVINMQEVVPVGKSGMGGASSPGLLASISAGLKAVLAGLWGADTSTLSTANLPPYTPAGTITNTYNTDSSGTLRRWITHNTIGPLGYGGTANGANMSNVDLVVTSAFAGTPQGGTSTAFNNTPPSKAVNFIIRIA